MERERKGKGLIIALLLVTILSLSVAFAATLSSSLNIEGTANIGDSKWNVYFKTATVDDETSNITAKSGPTITGNNLISYTVDLEENTILVIKAIIRNDGTYKAKLNNFNVSGAENYEDIITYSVTGIQKDDVIDPDSEKEITITVAMDSITNDNVGLLEGGLSLTLTATADFIQAE